LVTDFEFNKAQVIAVTKPVVDFIPDSEGILSYTARVSSPQNQDNFETAAGLLKYCMRNNHWSVFDMCNIVVGVESPRDILRQVLRHSSIKPQEFSQRYAEANNFIVREARLQDYKNRQNSFNIPEDHPLAVEWRERQAQVLDVVKENYKWAIDVGIAKECARVICPEGNTMSYAYLNGTVRSWITYLNVRDDEGVTQAEHVDLARKVKQAVTQHFPFLKEVYDKETKND